MSLSLISEAWAEGAAATGGATTVDTLMGLLPLVLFGVVFYFLLIRPQAKRQKEHKRMVDALGKGEEVIVAGGIAGRITDIGENFVQVEVADGVQLKIRRAAVESVLPKGSLRDL
jgi:preprotein translocase subunit YajC